MAGRLRAGSGFLAGFLEHADTDVFYVHAGQDGHEVAFLELAARHDPRRRPVRRLSSSDLAVAGALQLSDPTLAAAAQVRQDAGDPRAYSLCGVTHTLSSRPAMETIGRYLSAPVQPWDALVCTSHCAKAAVVNLLAARAEALAARLRIAPPRSPVRLPVIPLGVDARSHAADPSARARLRQRIGAGGADVVILTLGRLMPMNKAHPVPMLLAVERAAAACAGRGIRLHHVFVSQSATEALRRSYLDAASAFTEQATVHLLDGGDDAVVREAWNGADVFYTLSDNLQETFGLTPVEAMAAGLPCVVSDWNGYRDTVVDGETGFRIPTLMPAPGDGRDFADRLSDGEDDFAMFHARTCMAVACDLERAAACLQMLAEDAGLRRRMGAVGRVRAATVHDWRVVVGAYQDLWSELAAERATVPVRQPGPPASSVEHRIPDPFAAFAAHSTSALSASMTVTSRHRDLEREVARLTGHALNTTALDLSVPRARFAAILDTLAAGAVTVGELEAAYQDCDGPVLRRFLLWLFKFGAVAIRSG